MKFNSRGSDPKLLNSHVVEQKPATPAADFRASPTPLSKKGSDPFLLNSSPITMKFNNKGSDPKLLNFRSCEGIDSALTGFPELELLAALTTSPPVAPSSEAGGVG